MFSIKRTFLTCMCLNIIPIIGCELSSTKMFHESASSTITSYIWFGRSIYGVNKRLNDPKAWSKWKKRPRAHWKKKNMAPKHYIETLSLINTKPNKTWEKLTQLDNCACFIQPGIQCLPKQVYLITKFPYVRSQ